MAALATVGILVRVTPWDDLQYWPGPESDWEFVLEYLGEFESERRA